MNTGELELKFQTNLDTGLSQEEADSRFKVFIYSGGAFDFDLNRFFCSDMDQMHLRLQKKSPIG